MSERKVTKREGPPGSGQAVEIPGHPAMKHASPPDDLDSKLSQPYVPRANLAVRCFVRALDVY